MTPPHDPTPPRRGSRPSDEERALVRSEATSILRTRGLPRASFLDDAMQDGFTGLAVAARRFEADRGVAFSAYARPFVRGAILDGLKGALRSNVSVLLLRGADRATADSLAAEVLPDDALESQPSALAALRRSLAGYFDALGLGYLTSIRHLHEEEALAARHQHKDALAIVQQELASLPERDQRVLLLRDVEELSWDDVAARMSASKSTVQRWRAQAIRRLGDAIRRRGIRSLPPLSDTG